MKWEYTVKEEIFGLAQEEMEAFLNRMGEQGWELIYISSSHRTFVFKRPKIDTTAELDKLIRDTHPERR